MKLDFSAFSGQEIRILKNISIGIGLLGIILVATIASQSLSLTNPISSPSPLLTTLPSSIPPSLTTQEESGNLTPAIPPELTEPPFTTTPTSSPTPTFTPTDIPLLYNDNGDSIPITWGNFPGPTRWPETEIPPPMPNIPRPDDQIHILLLGSDERPGLRGYRTDTIILVSLNPTHGTASVVSFPRDLWVYAPGITMMKINSIAAVGGIDALFDTFEYNFNIRPDFYVMVNYHGFVELIDAMGGITIYSPAPLSDPTYAEGAYRVEAGWVELDGSTARFYAISRGTSNDFYRNQRQQRVLSGIFNQMLTIDALSNLPRIFEIYNDHFETDLSLSDLLPLIPLGYQLQDYDNIHQFSINLHQTEFSRTPVTDMSILYIDQIEMLRMLIDILTP